MTNPDQQHHGAPPGTDELGHDTLVNLAQAVHPQPDREALPGTGPKANAAYDLGDGAVLNVVCTDEGVVLDLYRDDEPVASVAMMANEWAEWMEAQRR